MGRYLVSRTGLMPVLLLLGGAVTACAPVEAVLAPPGSEDGEVPGDDGSSPDDDVIDGDEVPDDGDEVPDDDDETDSDEDPGDAYPLEWSGSRTFTFGFQQVCHDSVHEEGIEITQDAEAQELLAVCPECDHLFEIEVGPEEICDGWVQIRTHIYRGVELRENGTARLYNVAWRDGGWGGDEGWVAEPLADGTLSGPVLSYHYNGNYSGAGYEVEGEAAVD